jgi:putative DNA primase/helicase
MRRNNPLRNARVVEAALELTKQRHFVVPVGYKTKKPQFEDWTNRRLSVSEIPRYFANESNIGLLLGVPPHFVIDVDLDCEEATVVARLIHGPETARVSGREGRRASHYFFSLPEEFKTKKFACRQRKVIMELRGVAHQTIIPPSVHPSGEILEWEYRGPFGKTTGEEVLTWGARVASAALLAQHWPGVGRRHDGVLALSGMFAKCGQFEDVTIKLILAAAQAAGDEEWAKRECDVRSTFARATMDEAITGIPRASELFGRDVIERVSEWLGLSSPHLTSSSENSTFSSCTDAMNSQRFARQHAASLRFCVERNTWYAWTGTHWRPDALGDAMRCAVGTARSIYGDAQNEKDDIKRQQLGKWEVQSESRQRLESMVSLARFDLGIEVRSYAEAFDRNPWLLNCQNGTINLRNGAFSPHRSRDLITKISEVSYDSNADCPRWKRFLEEVTCGRSALSSYLQRVVGYILTGDTREHVFFLFYGHGNNGKTTFVNTIANLLGDYAHSVPFQEFIQKKYESGSNEIAQLQSVRFVYSMEAPSGRTFNEALLKQFSGGDKIRARSLYQESVEWYPEAKLLFAANHRPEIRETADAIWNRIQLCEFLATFSPETCDKELIAKLQEELPGILNWAVHGCLEWQQTGLLPPPDVIAANKDYRADNDPFSDFIRERCIIDRGAHVLSRDLYTAYLEWTSQNGIGYVMARRAVGGELSRRGYTCDIRELYKFLVAAHRVLISAISRSMLA